MASQGERIAALEVHRENHAGDLVELRADLSEVKAKVADIHSGMRVFIVIARVFSAFGIALLALKGAASWSDVANAFRSI